MTARVGNNLIEGNYIGTDATGTTSFPGLATGTGRLREHQREYDRRDHAGRPQPDLGQRGARRREQRRRPTCRGT